MEALRNIEIYTNYGLNQEMNLNKPRYTCWSSHYRTFVSLIHMFSSAYQCG